MYYTQEERLDIGRRIYNNEITRYEAAEEYGISDQTARTYMRLYRAPIISHQRTGTETLMSPRPQRPCRSVWRRLRQ